MSKSAVSGTVTTPQLKTRQRWGGQDLSLIAVFAALLVVSAVVPPIQIGNVLSVPLTLQTLVVTLTGLLLGASRAFAAVGLYTLLGLLGLPIFSGFRGGLAVLVGPGAGYLLSFPFASALVGAIAALILRRGLRQRALWFSVAGLAGMVLNHLLGIIGMAINGKLAFDVAVLTDLRFVPGDILKIVLAVIIALSLHRAFPNLIRRR
ncbi:BioY family protein [Renibacterium salmoninarum ATCC 33209]|uniref:Biotin transporter n=1 Tax=Renibacterium salmoninarum (strain ATCC 33209 / DSM 20767 / JCM 11484 / NBRC 15589 / NCIMB 2235) TaxID=288705 RepID=A9WSQ0_RENSM|nr:biotin transporter BioY [Renibacterium salmoninarum]ABY23838.1 BioY family protein [Renibacterium salmoninarum ATCC 33209]